MRFPKINGQFTNISSSYANTDIPTGWFSISYHWVYGKTKKHSKRIRRLSYGRWFKISSKKDSIYRVLKFSPSLRVDKRSNSGEIVLDYMGWIDLMGREPKTKEALPLTIRPVRFWEKYKCAVKHPEPAYRLASWMAILSLLLGLLSLGLAIDWSWINIFVR